MMDEYKLRNLFREKLRANHASHCLLEGSEMERVVFNAVKDLVRELERRHD